MHIMSPACWRLRLMTPIVLLFLLLLDCRHTNALIDPLSVGLVAGLGYLGYTGMLKDLSYCRMTECCTDRHIPADVSGLSENLTQSLFGQHIVVERLIPVLRAHYKALGDSRKPLVLSFHGTAGTGKNFVADRVADYLYRSGAGSKYVHKYLGRIDFPSAELATTYARSLYEDVRLAITDCPRSLFIFDEVDKVPAGVFDQLASLMDHHDNIGKVNFRQATYIFLSNAGGVQIGERLLEHLEGGAARHESRLSDYDDILTQAAYNVPGGLRHAAMIDAHLIDHFVPFLPMERDHVEACIAAEFRARGKQPSKELVAEILREHVTYQWGIFSTTGCKRLSKLIGMHAEFL